MVPSLAYLTTTIRSSPSVSIVATLRTMSSAGLVPPKLTPEIVATIPSTVRPPVESTMLVNVGTPPVNVTSQAMPAPEIFAPVVQLTLLTGAVYNVAAASVAPN